ADARSGELGDGAKAHAELDAEEETRPSIVERDRRPEDRRSFTGEVRVVARRCRDDEACCGAPFFSGTALRRRLLRVVALVRNERVRKSEANVADGRVAKTAAAGEGARSCA